MTAAGQRGGIGQVARTLAVAAALGCAGCASNPAADGTVRDPLEGFNRSMYRFNEGFDRAIAKPVATAYHDVLPSPIRTGVRNFFGNIDDLWIGINNLLQGKVGQAASDWLRFGVNSIVGIFGLIDVASEMGLEKHNEDFGQTFGRWGAGAGAYIVWPIIGSSDVRDSIGWVIDVTVDPVWKHEPVRVRNPLIVTRYIGVRADLLDASRLLEEAALDKYVFQRDAYLQRRRSLVRDGVSEPQSPPGGALRPPRENAEADERAAPDAAAAEAARLIEEPAVKSEPAPRAANSYEPHLPRNYEAVLAAMPQRP